MDTDALRKKSKNKVQILNEFDTNDKTFIEVLSGCGQGTSWGCQSFV